MSAVTQGVALALAGLLVSAGAPKLWRPGHVAGALRRVFGPRGSTHALLRYGRLLGAWELLLAAAVVFVGGPVTGVALAVTFAGFLGFVAAAVRRGSSCGCWASLTEGPAGGAELARTGVLAAAAVSVAVAGWPRGLSVAALGWAAVLLVAMALAAAAGGRVAPVRPAGVARRLARRAAPTRRGRVLARVVFLAGFVHVGTDAEQARLHRALDAARHGVAQKASA
ncbi:MauE/DoxX family redox-associated membrane protein [Actinophytocola glycyrrhizae]|uniref:MauE/DoxX family redox-associated membrane protein n=1 Tax=Actinophytocola glycyrrhizae TaxID=2044873 RepID=A0ABV9SC42_9PSEU